MQGIISSSQTQQSQRMENSNRQKIHFSSETYFTNSFKKHFYVHKKGRDPVCDWVINNKCIYEGHLLMMISPILRECSYMVDIGCHVGTYTYAKMLTGNYSNTLSIDASQENIETARMNASNHVNFNSIHGFWVEKSVANAHTLISSEYRGDHNKLHVNITNNPENSLKIPNVKTSSIYDWIKKEQQSIEPEANSGFIKIDIDGSEKNTAAELCALLIQAKAPFIMQIETSNPAIIEELSDLGLQILALLPGDNFLVCCPRTLTKRPSLFCLHQTFGLIISYLNKMANDDDWLRQTATQRNNKPIKISTPYGEHKCESSIVKGHWIKDLSKYDIPMFCYG